MITKEAAISALKNKFPEECLFFAFKDCRSDLFFPSEWRDFGIKTNLTDSAWYPSAWGLFSERLPWTHMAIRRCLIGTAVLYTQQPNLIYIFHDKEDYYFYIGKSPLDCFGAACRNKIENLSMPNDLIDFYCKLHNGFTFHPSNSMGPLSLEDQIDLTELYDAAPFPLIQGSTGIFHNGAGDYLALPSGANSQQSFIWWHEESEKPEINQNLWAVMDNWISIFLEDTSVLRN